MGEAAWFPGAATRDYIRWEAADSLSARATMIWGGVEATGTFHFDANSDLTGYEADRYMSGPDGGATLERWAIRMTGYREFHGVRIPCRGEVTWKLKTGDFTWLKYEITEIDYDP